MKIFLFGHPVAHSISPAIHNAALRELGLPESYEALDVAPELIPQAMAALRADDVLGCNVTVPHKQAVMPYLDALALEAARIGAVNTVVHRSGRLEGFNTDAQGFVNALRDEGLEIRGKRVLLVGAGGAARALAFALAEGGAASIWIHNRDAARAACLADDVRAGADARSEIEIGAGPLGQDALADHLRQADLVVNATTVGMHEARSPLAGCAISSRSLVCDIIYNPPETELLRQARAAGAQAINGLGMLVHQAALAFSIWTGRPAPIATMYQAAVQALEGGRGQA